MTTIAHPSPEPDSVRRMLNKVPEVTLYFWTIKILCTTVGETAADFLNSTLGLGLNGTSIIAVALLVGVLIVQFRAPQYVPWVYWTAVVLISIVGTLLTDKLTDDYGVALEVTTAVFSLALAATFFVWWWFERTLSIHTIVTRRREAFYWLAILCTFALGTAAGDLIAERFAIGYLNSLLLFAALIAVVAVAHLRLGLNAVFSFWAAYVLTRPLGASLGDYLASPRDEGGLGLGTTLTTAAFLAAILGLVAYLAATKMDRTQVETA